MPARRVFWNWTAFLFTDMCSVCSAAAVSAVFVQLYIRYSLPHRLDLKPFTGCLRTLEFRQGILAGVIGKRIKWVQSSVW